MGTPIDEPSAAWPSPCATLLLTGCDGVDDEPSAPRASGPAIETTEGTATPYGTGAGQVWVLRPRHGEVVIKQTDAILADHESPTLVEQARG